MKNTRLTANDLENVMGGTITPNMFEEKDYNRYGIKTEYHWVSPDEFWLPDGTKTDVYGANHYISLVDPGYYATMTIAWECAG